MHWEELFAALEDDARGLERGARDADFADRTRSAQAQVSWLLRCAGVEVALRVTGVGVVHGRVIRVTPQWLLLRDRTVNDDRIVAVHAGVSASGLSPEVVAEAVLDGRLGWTHAWRVLSRDRSEVRTTCLDGSVVRGVPAIVGSDYVEIRAYDGGRPTDAPPVAVPYTAIATVTCPR